MKKRNANGLTKKQQMLKDKKIQRESLMSERELRMRALKKSLHKLTSLSVEPEDKPKKRNARQKLTGRNYEELNIISKAKPKGRKFKEYTPEELKILNDKREELCQGGKTVAVKDLIKATNL